MRFVFYKQTFNAVRHRQVFQFLPENAEEARDFMDEPGQMFSSTDNPFGFMRFTFACVSADIPGITYFWISFDILTVQSDP